MRTILLNAEIVFQAEENETIEESVQRFKRLIGDFTKNVKVISIESETEASEECETEKDTKTLQLEKL